MADLPPVTTNDPHPAAHNAERTAINTLQDQMANKITMPGGAATGDLLRWDGTQWLTTETRFFEGVGNPNGKVAAPIGSRYVDKTGTRGAVTWDKTSGGESNAGWTSSIGPLSLNGEQGTVVIGGASAKTKSKFVPLNPDIFLGVAPRQVILSSGLYYANVYHTGKVPNGFTANARHLDNINFTAATNISVDWIALI